MPQLVQANDPADATSPRRSSTCSFSYISSICSRKAGPMWNLPVRLVEFSGLVEVLGAAVVLDCSLRDIEVKVPWDQDPEAVSASQGWGPRLSRPYLCLAELHDCAVAVVWMHLNLIGNRLNAGIAEQVLCLPCAEVADAN